jgi:hypothetical protein
MKYVYFPHFFFAYRDMLHSSQYLSTLVSMTVPGIHTSQAWKDHFMNKNIHTCNYLIIYEMNCECMFNVYSKFYPKTSIRKQNKQSVSIIFEQPSYV